jgi:integrase
VAGQHLTKSKIDGFTYAGGWDVRWDSKVTGFGVRIFASGKKSFVYSYRANGRKRLLTLGPYGKITLDEARALARKEAAKVIEGHDPIEERKRARKGETLADLIAQYIEYQKAHGKKTWQATQRRLDLHVPKSWRQRKVWEVTRADVAQLHRDLGANTPTNANRTLESLRAMFNLAKTWGLLDEMAPNPAERIPKYRETRRKRFVEPHELPKLASAIDQDPNVYRRAYFWLLLLTGARRSELQYATWDQVCWESGRLTLPDTKSGEEQFIPLNREALGILQAIPQVEGNPYIFAGDDRRKGGPRPIRNLSAPWKDICRRAGLEDLRIHDLRRTVGSYMSQAGVELNTIREGLRHASISTTLTYARLGQDPARQAMEGHGAFVRQRAGQVRDVS